MKVHDGVHAMHCCVIHGCKYGHATCPVVTKRRVQRFLCEQCDDTLNDAETTLREISEVRELAAKLRGDPAAVSYHPEVQYTANGAWGPPSVGNIQNGFDTPERVRHLIDVLQEHDAEYYAHAKFRIIKVTREVVEP